MNNRTKLFLPVSMLLAACAQMPQNTGPRTAGPGVPIKMPACGQAPAGAKIIVITANPGNFGVQPPRLCVARDPENDIEIKVRVTGAGDVHAPGAVRIAAKPFVADGGWLSGSNPGGPNDSFTISIPAGTTGTFLYDVTVDGYGTIDPMVSVEE